MIDVPPVALPLVSNQHSFKNSRISQWRLISLLSPSPPRFNTPLFNLLPPHLYTSLSLLCTHLSLPFSYIHVPTPLPPHTHAHTGWWFVNLDDFSEGWVPATYLDPLYGQATEMVEVLDAGEGKRLSACLSSCSVNGLCCTDTIMYLHAYSRL